MRRLIAILFLIYLVGCAGWREVAWRSTYAVQKAGEAVERTWGQAADDKDKACVAQHKGGTAAYAECIRATKSALAAWHKIRPVVSAAIIGMMTALQVAASEGDNYQLDWYGKLQASACGLLKMLTELRTIMPSEGPLALLNDISILNILCASKG